MKNYVISLKSASERREHIEKEFGKQQVNFEFFDALTPDAAKQYANQLGLDINPLLTPTELACMMSHIAVWEKVINDNTPYAAVFEDDVFLGEDAHALLSSSDWIKPNWHIIKLEAFSKNVFLAKKQYGILANKRKLIALQGRNLGAAGYLLSTKGCRLFLDYIFHNEAIPLDKLIFDKFIADAIEPVYQMLPALCEQEKILKKKQGDKDEVLMPSSLTIERQQRRKLEKKKGLKKIQREVTRVVSDIKRLLFATKIEFR